MLVTMLGEMSFLFVFVRGGGEKGRGGGGGGGGFVSCMDVLVGGVQLLGSKGGQRERRGV